METVHLDTHVALWFYGGRSELLSPRACSMIEEGDVFISPIVILEIQFLRESGRINVKADRFLRDMHTELGFKLSPVSLLDVNLQAVELSWTRDPFDRMIVASAMADEARLLTRDRKILKHYKKAVWDS